MSQLTIITLFEFNLHNREQMLLKKNPPKTPVKPPDDVLTIETHCFILLT